MAFIHVVDDDPLIRDSLRDFLEIEGHEVTAFVTAEDANEFLQKEPPDVILLDLKLPGMDGLEYLEIVKNQASETEVIMITGYANVNSAVKAMKLGAWDYIKKPFELDELSVVIQKAVETKKRNDQLAYLQEEQRYEFSEIIGTSKAMEDVFNFIRRVADSPRTSVLIRGETGTGKEMVAKAIHYNSPRAKKPFIEVNCSVFQENLLESELFGHEAGAFTDAKQRKKGLLEVANEGTFFLDEIGDMTYGLQAKILKVLEEKTFRRVGGTKEISVDVRLTSASSRDLLQAVSEGSFRQDLFYRLNVATIELPALRDRGEDVILLAEHFLQLYNKEFKQDIKGLSPEVKDLFRSHTWPGNARELRNVIERAVLFEKNDTLSIESASIINVPRSRGVPTPLTPAGASGFEIPPEGLSLRDVEKSLIEKALERTGGNQTRAAKLLGISREKLKYRVKKLGV